MARMTSAVMWHPSTSRSMAFELSAHSRWPRRVSACADGHVYRYTRLREVRNPELRKEAGVLSTGLKSPESLPKRES